MELVQCDDDDPHPDGCNVQIVSDMHFKNVDESHAKYDTPEFVTWWPSTAKTVIKGLYADGDARIAAVRTLLPVCDMFPSQQVMPLRMTTPEMSALHELYATRLTFDEQHIKGITAAWIHQVNALVARARPIVNRLEEDERKLQQSAQGIKTQYAVNPQAMQIVDAKLHAYRTRVQEAAQLQLRLARSESLLHEPVHAPDTHQIDQRIDDMVKDLKQRSTLPPEMFDTIRAIYDAHRRNIEADAAVLVQNECRKLWLDGLRGT